MSLLGKIQVIGLERLKAQFAEYRDMAAVAYQQTGKSLPAQFREIIALRKMGGQCGISDYYWYKLYDDSYQLGRGAPDFIGWRLQQEFSLALNPRMAVLPAWDKNVFTQLASSAGLPVAPVRGTFLRTMQIPKALGEHFRTVQEVARFLRNPDNYPLFAKPVYSQQGYGSAYLIGYDATTDRLALLNGETISLDSFLMRLETSVDPRYHKPECGFVFQLPLKPANEIERLTDWSALCGVRIVCLNEVERVIPIRAVWKIAVPPNHVDNFSLGKYGNLLADIDLSTGIVSRCVNALWPRAHLLQNHPQSGNLLTGFRLPGWERLLEACQIGGVAFPLMKIQHWDFALTDNGPIILELNDLGATEMLQIHGHGLLTPETREFLKRHANAASHAWVKLL